MSDAVYYKSYPTSEAVPTFYGLPKIHKNSIPVRPIVSSIGSITHKTAKYLARVLSPLVGRTAHFVKKKHTICKEN